MDTKILVIICCMLIIAGCEELFEKDLSSQEVKLFAPADNIKTTNSSNQIFEWESVKGADRYNLLVVSPGFDNIRTVVLDTNLTKTSFSVQLQPGTFQWGVSAFNNTSSTPFSIRTIVVDTNKIFSNNQVDLYKPEKIYLNNTKVLFSWSKIDNADKYRFEIRSGNWSGNVLIAKDVVYDTVTINLQEGNFYWGVQAIDNETNSQSRFSSKQIVIDVTKPGTPALYKPDDNAAITTSTVKLEWKRQGNNESGISDSVFVSKNSQFSDILIKAATNDSTFTVQPGNGEFFWRVKSIDLAGNSSDYSSYRKFNVSN